MCDGTHFFESMKKAQMRYTKGEYSFKDGACMQRNCGVLMPISSLPSMTSIGDFGHEGERFVDFLVECGFTYWQTLPFCLPDEFHSPYKSEKQALSDNISHLEVQ